MSEPNAKRLRTESLGISSPPSIKISQRPPKSCTECIRRKTRCNKQVPCEPCLKRKVGLSCRLENQYATASVAHTQDSASFTTDGTSTQLILAEIDSLRKRISDLERSPSSSGFVLNSSHDAPHSSNANTAFGIDQDGRKGETSDAGTTLEYLALGMDRRLGDSDAPGDGRRSQRAGERPPRLKMIDPDSDFTVPESVSDALLPRNTVTSILAYAESHVLWQHCCIHPPTFRKEVDAFWDAIAAHGSDSEGISAGWASIEPTWIALLYVVMGIAVHQMDEYHAAGCGLSDADRLVLPNAFVSAAEDALYAGSFMTRPSLWTVQAIAILSLCGHNVCDSDLLSSLLAVGIKMAQSLGLHSLGRRSRAIETKQSQGVDLSSHVDVAEVVDVEMGKRVWWALVLEDWFAIPFRGVWAIHPDQMDTPMPFNCHSEDLQVGRYLSRGDGVITIAQKHRFSSQVASILQQVFQGLRSSNSDALRIVSHATGQIEQLLVHLPDCLKPLSLSHGQTHEAEAPPYVSVMRHYIQISARHKLLVINRAYLAHAGPKEARVRAHEACVQNAKAILQELDRGQHQGHAPMQSLWTIPYHSVAAAVVLALDMIKLGSDGSGSSMVLRDRKHEIHRATQALQRLAPTSRIARRGLQVLSGLVGEINAASQDLERRKGDHMGTVVTNMKLPSNDMILTSLETDAEWSSNLASTSHGARPYDTGVSQGLIGVAIGPNPQPMYEASCNAPTIQGPPVATSDPASDWASGPMLPISPDIASGLAQDGSQIWNQEDIDRILSSLQESLPDVGRLFDGSIGMF